MARVHPPRRGKPTAPPQWLRGFALPVLVFIVVFAATTYGLTPTAPGRAEIVRYISERAADQHFANCSQARARGRENIPRWDPSYRPRLDRDGDGLACEPWRGG